MFPLSLHKTLLKDLAGTVLDLAWLQLFPDLHTSQCLQQSHLRCRIQCAFHQHTPAPFLIDLHVFCRLAVIRPIDCLEWSAFSVDPVPLDELCPTRPSAWEGWSGTS